MALETVAPISDLVLKISFNFLKGRAVGGVKNHHFITRAIKDLTSLVKLEQPLGDYGPTCPLSFNSDVKSFITLVTSYQQVGILSALTDK